LATLKKNLMGHEAFYLFKACSQAICQNKVYARASILLLFSRKISPKEAFYVCSFLLVAQKK